MIQDLTDLALNKIPIRLGSLINSVEIIKKSNKYMICIQCRKEVYGGWIDFIYNEKTYSLYYIVSYKKKKWNINDNIYITRLASSDPHRIHFNNEYYYKLDNIDRSDLTEESVCVNEKII